MIKNIIFKIIFTCSSDLVLANSSANCHYKFWVIYSKKSVSTLDMFINIVIIKKLHN